MENVGKQKQRLMFPWGAGEGSSRGFPRRQNLVVAVSWMVRAQSPWEEKRSSWKEDDDLRQERKGPSIRKIDSERPFPPGGVWAASTAEILNFLGAGRVFTSPLGSINFSTMLQPRILKKRKMVVDPHPLPQHTHKENKIPTTWQAGMHRRKSEKT